MQVFRANGFALTNSCNLPLFILLGSADPRQRLHLPLFINHSFPLVFSSPSHYFPLPPWTTSNNNNRKAISHSFRNSTTFMESTKRPYFLEEDDGLASVADMEAGYSGYNSHYHRYQHGFVSRSMGYAASFNRSSFRNLSVSSPRSGRFYDARFEDHQPHFLEACFLCKKPLGDNRDIFMYRGDIPFCSEECRQEQMEIDEAKEKDRNLSSSMKALRKKDQRKSTSPNKAQDYSFRTGTVAAA